MSACRTCRHSTPLPPDAVADEFTRVAPGGGTMSVLDFPDRKHLRAVTGWRQCKAHDELVAPDHACEHFASARVAGIKSLFGYPPDDTVLYSSLSLRRKIDRERTLREHERKTKEAEAKRAASPCESCGLFHAKCDACRMARSECGQCKACGAGVRLIGGRFQCQLCETPAAKPTAKIEWDRGLCDGCRAAKYPPPKTEDADAAGDAR